MANGKAGDPQFQPVSPGLNYPAFSPDGKWLAYTSPESGTREVYVRPAPDSDGATSNGRWQISNNGGDLPHWSRDGRTLVYQAGESPDDRRLHGAGRHLRSRDAARVDRQLPNAEQWDLSPDGKRVIALMPVEAERAPQADHDSEPGW